ncbi:MULTISPECIES: Npun_F5749 family FMN-dependent PPOX-type flavoprotein [unclassified Coleofasciculus]|uniref:Npun_F5749 family FMN-dependent PPOX-type flavoprotein n=1 Tax=unclassified Coleofasciculus TaxID=2692782 RepID=UPI001881A989|nr:MULTISPECIES: Npun_F5749 family FMN-dependent PPOX-type flavoprotein [unclassified Coleofasciculus]MBE9124661.1 pyridoxamine 5'-phosphate oxidase family protein [Coleofasciculus sp. LEGE 07081]MBE9146988.1 pyridoxamine 5'-phosphate oxidase family protein [Coleofasciculus sp. LEGE 07092]
MVLTPWRSLLSRALHQNSSLPYARYFQLATVRSDGRPANRTVVFRGFFGDTNQLKIITDARSQKVNQIEHQSWGEACWYFPKSREQFRLAGELTLVRADYPEPELKNARQTAWQDLSDSARLQFAWQPHPGEVRTEDQDGFSPPLPDPKQPLPNFCLLLLKPIQVDHLQLRGNPQDRWLYSQKSNGEWLKQAVNP